MPIAERRAHIRPWPEVDRLFADLPSHLFRQAKLLRYDLALSYSPNGQFEDIFIGRDEFPLLSIAPWLLDDLGFAESPERDEIERHLYLVGVLLAGRTHAVERMSDRSSFYGDEHLALVELLSGRITSELGHVVPRGSRFWEERDALVVDELEDQLVQRELRRAPAVADEPEAYLRGRWSFPAKVLALAAHSVAGQEDPSGEVAGLLGTLSAAFQIQTDLKSLHRDLQLGRATFVIATIARAAGMPLDPWPDPNSVLGAMAVTNSLEALLGSSLARIQDCRRLATKLRLPTIAAYAEDLEAHMGDHSPAALLDLSEPALPKALTMAEAFLFSDPTLKESWELHREGMFGAAEVASRFPAALILEMLIARGQDLTGPVDDFLAFTAANRFRYYAHPWSGVDSDTIGVFLRLREHATDPGAHTDALHAVLGCLERNVRETRQVPVWLTGCDPVGERPPVVDLGENCGTVAAHLLLGLCRDGVERYGRTIEVGAWHLLARIRDVGLGANVNYPKLFALAAFFRITRRLAAIYSGTRLGERAEETQRILRAELELASRMRPATPQEAGLLTIACVEGAAPGLVDPRWAVTILKGQRFDGSWSAEPFAAAPNRGNSVTWYSSTALTTAICYDGLSRCAPPTS